MPPGPVRSVSITWVWVFNVAKWDCTVAMSPVFHRYRAKGQLNLYPASAYWLWKTSLR